MAEEKQTNVLLLRSGQRGRRRPPRRGLNPRTPCRRNLKPYLRQDQAYAGGRGQGCLFFQKAVAKLYSRGKQTIVKPANPTK